MNLVFKLLASLGVSATLALCVSCSTNAGAHETPKESAPAAESVTLAIEGMTCASCSTAIRTALKRLDGVRDARVKADEKRAVVDYEPAKVTPQQMVDAVNKLGYQASVAPKGA